MSLPMHVYIVSLLTGFACGARMEHRYDDAKSDLESQWPSSSRDKRKCQACSAYWSTFSQGVNAEDNMAKKAFFLDKGDTLINKLRPKCPLAAKDAGDCIDLLNKATSKGTVPICWSYDNAEDFCGCVVGGGNAGRKRACPADVKDAPSTSEEKDAKPKPKPSKPKPTKIKTTYQASGDWPTSSRDKRKCLSCSALWEDFETGVNLDNNRDKKKFFLDDDIAGQLRPKCSLIEGIGDKYMSDCSSMLNKASAKSTVPICWDLRDSSSFCGCVVSGGNAMKKHYC